MSDDGGSLVVSDGDPVSTGRIVWILGSGFSAPLGGPMLNDLLSLALNRDIAARYDLHKEDDGNVLWLYHFGRHFSEGWPRKAVRDLLGEHLWNNAEEFLEYLDSCSDDSVRLGNLRWILTAQHESIQTRPTTELIDVKRAARRHIAAECTAFLENVNFVEKWLPYQRWGTLAVGRNDIVVTFNYDCVLERLNDLIRASGGKDVISVLDTQGLKEWPEGAKALKLHGSTSWGWEKNSEDIWEVVSKGPNYAVDGYWQDRKEFALVENELGSMTSFRDERDVDDLVLALPGPSKYRSSRSLSPWWDKAVEAIADADAVVFVGYRFPPSDSFALETLTRAISNNHRSDLKLHTVLGPKLHDDTVRLQQLLNYATRSKVEVNIHRLWSQDFMTVVNRADLL